MTGFGCGALDGALAGFTCLAGLPVLAGVNVEACEPAPTAGKGVNADGVIKHEGVALILRRVSAYDGFARFMWLRIENPLPEAK